MAQTLSKTNIVNGQVIQAWNVTQSVDAFTGAEAYDITVSGSFTLSGPTTGSGYFTNALAANQIRPQNVAVNQDYTIPYLASTGSLSALYYSAIGPKYNPTTNVLTTTASLAVTASYVGTANQATNATYINGGGQANVSVSGSNGIFTPASLGILAGSVTLTAGSSVILSPVLLTGKIFQTDFFVTATKASGSTSPGATGVLYVESPGLGTFRIKESGASSNDDVNFTVIYK